MGNFALNSLVDQYVRVLKSVVCPGDAQHFLQDLEVWRLVISHDQAGWNFLTRGGCSPTRQKEKILEILEKMSAQKLTRRFIQLLLSHGHLSHLMAIIQYYEKSVARGDKMEAVLQTARPLDPERIQDLEEKFSKMTPSGLSLHTEVDPDLLGGGVLFLGDWMIDGSVKSILERAVA